jgi:hypothetical protein
MYADAITIDKAKRSVRVPNPKEAQTNLQNSPQALQFNSWDEEGGRLDCKALSILHLCNISPPLLLWLNVHHPVMIDISFHCVLAESKNCASCG